MRLKNYQIVLTVIVLTMISCTDIDKSEQLNYVEFQFSSEEVLSENKNGGGWEISNFTIHPSGYIYFAERYRGKITKFTLDGDFITSAGGIGEGPGEFTENSFIFFEWNGDELWAHNNESQRAHIYNRDLNYLHTRYLDQFQFDSIRKGKHLIRHNHSHDTNFVVQHFIDGVEEDTEFQLNFDPFASTMNMLHLGLIDDARFYAAFWYRNEIHILNFKGELLHTIRVPEWPEKSDMRSVSMPEFIVIKSVTSTENGEIIVLGGGFSENVHQDLHIFDADLNYRLSLTLPNRTSMVEYFDGAIYAIKEDRTNIIRWDLTLEELL